MLAGKCGAGPESLTIPWGGSAWQTSVARAKPSACSAPTGLRPAEGGFSAAARSISACHMNSVGAPGLAKASRRIGVAACGKQEYLLCCKPVQECLCSSTAAVSHERTSAGLRMIKRSKCGNRPEFRCGCALPRHLTMCFPEQQSVWTWILAVAIVRLARGRVKVLVRRLSCGQRWRQVGTRSCNGLFSQRIGCVPSSHCEPVECVAWLLSIVGKAALPFHKLCEQLEVKYKRQTSVVRV